MNYKNFIKKIILNPLRRVINPKKINLRFEGWGLESYTNPPWDERFGKIDSSSKDFIKVNDKLKSRVKDFKFKSSQFIDASMDMDQQLVFIDSLRWRHYNIFKTVELASRNQKLKNMSFIELGVADGMTSFFAFNSAKRFSKNLSFYLYDSWANMKEEYLTKDEILDKRMNHYGYLDVNTTQNNLIEYKENITYIKGYIPESFTNSLIPENIVWLHIDLNSTLPTIAGLEMFCDKLCSGGVILFDDYAWESHKDTKVAIDDFFSSKNFVAFPLVTGQGMFLKL